MDLRTITRAAVVAGGLAAFTAAGAADPEKEALRKSLKDIELVGPWVYDDVEAGFASARTTGKPLLVVFR